MHDDTDEAPAAPSRAMTAWTWGLSCVAVAATGVIVSGLLHDPEPELTTAPPTTTTTVAPEPVEYSYVSEPVDYPTDIPGCDVVEPPADDASFGFVQNNDFGYDHPSYPWFSGPKAAAMSEALTRTLPDTVDVEFAPIRQSLVFGPIFDPDTTDSEGPAIPVGWTDARATIRRGDATGSLSVSVRQSTDPIPACVAGVLDERRHLGDGTIVDVDDTWWEVNGVRTLSRSARAYAPDGTAASAYATDARNTEDGEVHAGRVPLTLDELVALVTVPELRVTTPVPPGTPGVPAECHAAGGGREIDESTASRLDGVLATVPVADLGLDRPLGSLHPAGYGSGSVCQAVNVTAPGHASTLSVAIAAGVPLPEPDSGPVPADHLAATARSLPDGTVIEHSERRPVMLSAEPTARGEEMLVRTVTVTRPSGMRVEVTSTAHSPAEPLPAARLEAIASTPGLEV